MTDNVQVPGFKVIRKVGEGGMATVYLALQESLDREVALKVMSPALAANANFCEQFMKEGRIAAKLTHPHLMTVHDIGEENGVYYLASEYLPAGTLRERMEGIGVAEVLEIARDVAASLAYAHENGFVHRDVKPGNIMFRADGTAVLADFGIAKAMKATTSQTMTGTAIGTPDYMSPEQAQATPLDGRADLYSLGAVLFECLAGHRPYRAGDPYTVALMHVTEPVPTLPENLAWLQPLIEGLMAKNPEQRFATGEAFIAECEKLVAAHPEIQAPVREKRTTRKRTVMPRADSSYPAASNAPAATSSAGNRRWVATVAGVLVLFAMVSGWYWTHRSPQELTQTSTVPVVPNVVPPPPAIDDGDDKALQELKKLNSQTLLERGERYLAYGRENGGSKLDFPSGDNAIDLFQEALRREPGNARAEQGLAQIAAFYASGARSALANGAYTGAEVAIEAGLRADPKNTTLLKLKEDLAKVPQSGG